MTMPGEDTDDREAGPLGSEVAPPGDRAHDEDGGTSGVAGPSYPPEGTEPDASATAR